MIVGKSACYHSMNRKRDGNIVLLSMAGKLLEVTAKGNEVASFQVGDASANWCGVEGLSGRRYLCVNINRGEVIEVDTAGKVHWKCTIPGASYVVLDGGGHFVPQILPEPYNRAVGGFLLAQRSR